MATAATGAGAALGAGFSAACCAGPVVAPLVVGVLGAGGAAWAAGLKPYSLWILAGSGLLLTFALWSLYRPRPRCEAAEDAARSPVGGRYRIAHAVVWAACALWLLSLAVNLLLP